MGKEVRLKKKEKKQREVYMCGGGRKQRLYGVAYF